MITQVCHFVIKYKDEVIQTSALEVAGAALVSTLYLSKLFNFSILWTLRKKMPIKKDSWWLTELTLKTTKKENLAVISTHWSISLKPC